MYRIRPARGSGQPSGAVIPSLPTAKSVSSGKTPGQKSLQKSCTLSLSCSASREACDFRGAVRYQLLVPEFDVLGERPARGDLVDRVRCRVGAANLGLPACEWDIAGRDNGRGPGNGGGRASDAADRPVTRRQL